METDDLERQFEASELCLLLQNVMDVLQGYPLGKVDLLSLDQHGQIAEKIAKQAYTCVGQFKTDVDELFRVLRRQSRACDEATVEQVYVAVLNSVSLEVRSLLDVTLPPVAPMRVALFRPAIDGFLFSDASARIPADQSVVAPHMQTIAVHPSTSFDAPSFKETLLPALPDTKRPSVTKDNPILPVQWLDYGAFSSFAPVYDSTNSNVSYDASFGGVTAKKSELSAKARFCGKGDHLDDEQDKDGAMEVDLDHAWLASQGLDAQAIERHVASPNLGANQDLIDKLIAYQEHRFANDEHDINDAESSTASQLQEQLNALVGRIAPQDVVDSEQVEAAMARQTHYVSTYRGSLPPNRLFALPSSDTLDATVPPPYTNITPTYSKERWRMPDARPSEGVHTAR